jgi:hypothetical protein
LAPSRLKNKRNDTKGTKGGNICYKQLFGETLQQAMLNPIDIEEALEELNEAESSKSMDIDDTS